MLSEEVALASIDQDRLTEMSVERLALVGIAARAPRQKLASNPLIILESSRRNKLKQLLPLRLAHGRDSFLNFLGPQIPSA
jgi:hypothetical protein